MSASRVAVGFALTATACSGPQPAGEASVETAASAACRQASVEQERAVRELTYLKPQLAALRWPAGGQDADGYISEAQLFDAVKAGKVKFVFVQARGGLGKTEMSKALVAETCQGAPSFRVDLRTLFGPSVTAMPAGNAIEAALVEEGKRLGVAPARFIATIDAIEEVPVDRRTAVIAQLAEARKLHPDGQFVLMGRPSVSDRTYGITDFDAIVEIPPLDCGRARSSLLRLSEDEADRKRVNGFVAAWQLDRQSLQGQRCYFPYLATYRDIDKVRELAKDFQPAPQGEEPRSNLTQVAEKILASRLEKELTDLRLSADEAMAAVDGMVGNGGWVDGEWNLSFNLKRCVSGQANSDAARNRAVCEKLFQSVLLERVGGTARLDEPMDKAEWGFGPNQDIADLFVARWIDGQILRKNGDCSVVDQQAEMIAGKNIASYLIGRSGGGKCLSQLAKVVCKGGFQKGKLEQLNKGLPVGPARADVLKTAKEQAKRAGLDPCSAQLLNGLQ